MTRTKLSYVNHENGSTITGEATTKEAGVGGRGTAMFIDEFSRIEQAAELLAGTADTSPCRIFNFTPWGAGANTAFKLASRPDVAKLRMHWSEHPHKSVGLYQFNTKTFTRDILDKTYSFPPDYKFIDDGRLRSVVYDSEERRRGPREMAENWDIDYHGSTYQFFDKQLIVDYQRDFCRDPYLVGDLSHDPDLGRPLDWVTIDKGPIKLWMNLSSDGRPPPDKYVIACDVSTGTGATNSCASAISVTTGEKVLEFATPILRADQFASKVIALCLWLRDTGGEGAYLGWEMQGPGVPFGKKVAELRYSNVFYRRSTIVPWSKPSDLPGWVPNPDTKRVLMEDYRTALAMKSIINRSMVALDECLAIVHLPNGDIQHTGSIENEDPTGARINHGDRVVADALAWKLVMEKQTPREVVIQKVQPGSMAWRRQQAEREDRESITWQ